MTFWRKLGLACGQDPANWPWETEEEAYFHILEPLGLGGVESYNDFVDYYRMYFIRRRTRTKFKANGF